MGQLIDARTAAARLGVDVRTLYAYVSRGSLRRVPGPDGRSSRYDADELDLLARRSRPRTLPRPAASIDLVIATRVSTVTDGLVRYRGTDVLDLVAAGESFEAVASRLWSPGNPVLPAQPAVTQSAIAAPIARALADVPVVQRFAAVVASMSATTQPTWDWAAWGRSLVNAQVEASGPAHPIRRTNDHRNRSDPNGQSGAPATNPAEPVAQRLWRRWSPLQPTPPRTRALNTALVLLAEHELALSTLAVRVAASARAAPAGCLLAGLGVLSGALHGDAGRMVQERLAARGPAAGPELGIGFGHSVHRHGDPRAAPLLEAVRAIATPADRDLVERAAGEAPAPPNIDFALGALCHVARMPPGAATGIFAVARTAGWIAHAAEEYSEPPLRFRGQAVVQAR